MSIRGNVLSLMHVPGEMAIGGNGHNWGKAFGVYGTDSKTVLGVWTDKWGEFCKSGTHCQNGTKTSVLKGY